VGKRTCPVFFAAYTWTQGTDDTAPHGETTFWVEGISGSASLNDISFEVNDSDANCGPDGTDADPVAPQDEYVGDTYATTTLSDASNPAADVSVSLLSLNAPNAGDTGLANWQTQPWLIGQMVDLQASVVGPYETGAAKYSWNVPSGDNILYRWDAGVNTPVAIPLANVNLSLGDSLAGGGSVTGKKEQEIQFFWVSVPGTNPDEISLDVTGIGPNPLQVYSAWTRFNVAAPTVTGATITLGNPSVNQATALAGVISGVYLPNNLTASGTIGEISQAVVAVPPAFSNGTYNFLQVVAAKDTRYDPQDPDYYFGHAYGTVNTATGLDGSWPFNNTTDPYGNANGWATNGGSPHYYTDAPNLPVNYATAFSQNEAFTQYLMFLAPGSGSQWVPLDVGTWGFQLVGSRPTVRAPWVITTRSSYGNEPAHQFAPTITEPTWTFVESAAANFR